MPRLVPSVDDVRATAVLSYSFPDIKFEEQAFDPYGFWSIFFDGNNALGKDIVELKEAERLLSISKKQLQDHFGDTWRTEFDRIAGDENYAVELFGDTRGRIVYDLASRAVRLDNRFQDEYNPILQELDVLRRELLEASVGGQDTEVIAAKYCSVAERIGARVAFVSYDELI
jgi:hypothetical protein